MNKYAFLFGVGISFFAHSFCMASEESTPPKSTLTPLSPGLSSVDPEGIWDPATPPKEWGTSPLTPPRFSLESPGSEDKEEDESESDSLSAVAGIGSALDDLVPTSYPLAPPGLGFSIEDHGGIAGLELYKKRPEVFEPPSFLTPPIFYEEKTLRGYPAARGAIILGNPREEILFCVGCHRFDIAYMIACGTQDTFSQCFVLLVELETSAKLLHPYNPYIALRKINTELWNPQNLSFLPTFYHIAGRARIATGHHEVRTGNLDMARVHFLGAIQIAKGLKNEALFYHALISLKSIL